MFLLEMRRSYPCKKCGESFPTTASRAVHVAHKHLTKEQRLKKNKQSYEQQKRRDQRRKAEAAAAKANSKDT